MCPNNSLLSHKKLQSWFVIKPYRNLIYCQDLLKFQETKTIKSNYIHWILKKKHTDYTLKMINVRCLRLRKNLR